MKKRPWTYIEPFTGEAAKALTKYLNETHADPKEQAKVDAAIRKSAARSVDGDKLRSREQQREGCRGRIEAHP